MEEKKYTSDEPIRIVVFEKSGTPRQFKLEHSVRIGYGRPEGVRDGVLYLDYEFLDEKQSELTKEADGSWSFADTSDKNDCSLNGSSIDDGRSVKLNNRDTVRIRDRHTGYEFSFIFLFDFKIDIEWKVIPLQKKQNVVHFFSHLPEEEAMKLDRDNALSDVDEHHALLRTVDDQWTVEDVNTHRGVYVNNEKIDGIRKLHLFDVVMIGDTLFLCQKGQVSYNNKMKKKNRLAIHIEERAVWNMLKKRKLISDIDLVIDPGNLVLILGGSGAGKTTFINAVTGYEKADATISEGGVDIYENYDQIKYEIGFVPQQDLLRGEDTVISTLNNAAQMRMPKYLSKEDREKRVSQVLGIFGLESVKKSLVEKLSGGQRKRLSIAVEFMADPSLFILDEPDSGLDGVMARELVEQLRHIADQQKIVMVITHTPDRVIDLFDQVIVLAKDSSKVGRLAFFGSISEAKRFFGKDSMEGIVRAINSAEEGGEGRADEFVARYKTEYDNGVRLEELITDRKENDTPRSSGIGKSESAEDPFLRSVTAEAYGYGGNASPSAGFGAAGRGTADRRDKGRDSGGSGYGEEGIFRIEDAEPEHMGRLGQIKVYLGKLMRLFITQGDWKVIPMAVVISVLIAMVVGGRIFGDMDGTRLGSFAVVCVCIWNGFFNSIQVVCRERAIIKREHRSGLHITSYIAAHMIYQAFICMAQVVIFIVCFNVLGINMPAKGAVTGSFLVDFCITLFLITYAADMMALMVSCIVGNTTTAMTVMPFLLIIQLVFSGIAFPLAGNLEKASNLTLSKWGSYAICSDSDYNSQPNTILYSAINQFRGFEPVDILLQYIDTHNDLRWKMDMWNSENMQNPDYEFSRKNVGKQWGILLGYAALYALIGTAALENIDRDKR
ncbi:MAG: ATP-binding cassette domain-containing protein [Clostridiales bacterium]|nr:ATP-binding cassette domain-containing protein [Clostridiales bacterium]